MTMTNAEWIIKTGHTFKQLRLIQHNELANRTYTVMLCDEPIAELSDKKEPLDVFRRWLDAEHIEPILDDVERKYLTAVIRPFRGRVKYICKIESRFRMGMQFSRSDGEGARCRIRISTGDNYCDDSITFPLFASGTMYKGMEPEKKYTLEELGL